MRFIARGLQKGHHKPYSVVTKHIAIVPLKLQSQQKPYTVDE